MIRFEELTTALLTFVALSAATVPIFSGLSGVTLMTFHPSIKPNQPLLLQQRQCKTLIEERIVDTCRTLEGVCAWAELCTLIRVTATCDLLQGEYEIVGKAETQYYISSLSETARQFAYRIRSHWGVDNKVHYV